MTLHKSTTHFRGRIVRLTTDDVTLPNGHRAELEIVHHPGGAAVVALDEHQQVCLLRQYRHAVGGWILELPAGKLEPNEQPLATAQRELIEEAGLRGREWQSLGACTPSPGILTEVVHLFLATGLETTRNSLERAEVLEVRWVPLEQAFGWVLDGTITDAKTGLGLTRARHVVAEGRRPAPADS